MDAVSEYKIRRQKRLDAKAVASYRKRRDERVMARYDDDEEEGNNGGGKKGGGGHGNTKLPFGLCQRFGIEVGKDWTPRDAWDALAGKGITPGGAYDRLKKGEDPGKTDVAVTPKKIDAESATKAYKERQSRVAQLEKDLKVTNNQITSAELYEADIKRRAVERAKERIAVVEQQEKLINGRSRDELGEEVSKAEEEYNKWVKENDKLYSRPQRGTAEREEWDKWLAEKGGWGEYSAVVAREVYGSDGAYGKYSEAKKALRAYNDLRLYGGKIQAERSLEIAKKELDEMNAKVDRLKAEREEIKRNMEEAKRDLESARVDYASAVKSKFPTYRDCKTNEDVMERLDCEGYFKDGQTSNLSGIPLGGAIRVAEDVDRFFQKNPVMKGKLGRVVVTRLKNNYYGQAGSFVELNDRWYGNREEYEKSYEGCVASKFHPEGTTYRSVVAHEYTHLLDSYMTRNLDLGMTAGGRHKKFSAVVFEEVRKNLKMSAEDCKMAVSRYAFKNKSGGAVEFLAEAYCEYLESPSPRPVAMEVGRVIQEYMKKLEEKK